MAVTRTIYVTIDMSCCRDGDVIYHPLPRKIIAPQTKDTFGDESLDAWAARAEAALDTKYRQMAADECSGMGATPTLCNFSITVDNVEETGRPAIPTSACDLYREYSREIARSRRDITGYEDSIADILASVPEGEELTTAQRRDISRLTEEVRTAQAVIREDTREMRDLEAEYPRIREECS